MSLLNQVIRGKVREPDFLLIHGPDKVGKTTFSAGAPAPLIIGPEDGAKNIDVPKLPKVTSYRMMIDQMRALLNDPHEYKSVGIDSLDHIEPLIWQQLCDQDGVTAINQVGGGYGNGYTMALKVWDEFLHLARMLREKRGMNVHLIAHSTIKTFKNPQTGTDYDRYVLKMNDKASALVREKVDTILFANYVTYTKGKEGQKHKAFGDGSRRIYTEWRPGYDAGNRLGLPGEMPLAYADYAAAIARTPEARAAEIVADLKVLMEKCDPELKVKVEETMAKAGTDPEALTIVRDRLRDKLVKKEEAAQ